MFARFGSEKGRKVLVELVLIVLGISIALWFEGLAEDLQEDEIADQYLVGLLDDLQTDIKALDFMISSNQDRIVRLEKVVAQLDRLADAPPEVLAEAIFTPSSYHFFLPANFTYLSMQESGHFRLLSDPEIKRGILMLMQHYQFIDELQRNFIQALDDGFIPLVMGGYDMLNGNLADAALTEDTGFRNFFVYTLQDTEQRLEALELARVKAHDLLESIKLTTLE